MPGLRGVCTVGAGTPHILKWKIGQSRHQRWGLGKNRRRARGANRSTDTNTGRHRLTETPHTPASRPFPVLGQGPAPPAPAFPSLPGGARWIDGATPRRGIPGFHLLVYFGGQRTEVKP